MSASSSRGDVGGDERQSRLSKRSPSASSAAPQRSGHRCCSGPAIAVSMKRAEASSRSITGESSDSARSKGPLVSRLTDGSGPRSPGPALLGAETHEGPERRHLLAVRSEARPADVFLRPPSRGASVTGSAERSRPLAGCRGLVSTPPEPASAPSAAKTRQPI